MLMIRQPSSDGPAGTALLLFPTKALAADQLVAHGAAEVYAMAALDIVNRLRPSQVYVYAMGQEPWLTFLTSIKYTPQSRPIVESDKLVDECRNRGLVAERLFGHKELLLDSAEPKQVSAAYQGMSTWS